MLEMKDLYWLAGILEGEGCFYLMTKPNTIKYPTIAIGMTDSDIIYKVAGLFGGKRKVTISRHKPLYTGKTMYSYNVHGELAIQWMMTLYGLMGNRRREKIREILNYWKAQEDTLSVRRIKGVCRHGHEWTPESTDMTKGYAVCRICANFNAQFYYNFAEFSKGYPDLDYKQLKEKFFEVKTQRLKTHGSVLNAINARSACINGHEWTVENTYIKDNGGRSCKICMRLSRQFSNEFIAFSKEYPTLTPKQLKEKFLEIKTQEADKQKLN